MKPYAGLLLAGLLFLTAGCGSQEPQPAKKPPASSAPAAKAPLHQISKESDEWYHKAAIAYGKGDHLSALEACGKALENDPENYKALSLKGIIQAFDVSPEEGIATIKESLAINPDYVQAFYDMAMAQKLGKHYDESIAYFQKVLAADPKNTWSYYGITTNYADKRDKEHALQYLKKAIDLSPADVKQTAKTQDHFAWLRTDPDFKAMTS